MSIQAHLAQIRGPWIQRASQTLARGSGLRESFEAQLTRFFERLEQAVLTGDTGWIDPVLQDWARTPTETDLEKAEYHVAHLVSRLTDLTIGVARETLSQQAALELISVVVPVFSYALGVVTRFEMEARLAHITNQMAELHRNMDQLNRSKTNFISIAAHELKTPLTLIEGYSAMMRDMAITQPAEMGELMQGVATGMVRLRQIVDDMIDVSLIDNQLLTLNLQPVQLAVILERLEADFAKTLRDRKQTFVVKEFDGSKSWIYGDPERIHQAIKNVLANAIKFTPDQGSITVDGRILPGFHEVIVTDTGIGISLEDQTHIFDKFGQVGPAELHSSGKTKFKGGGPGLGLAIARGIVQAHGGSIWVESEGYDEKALYGSTFHILLPSRAQPTDARVVRLFQGLEASRPDIYGQEETPTDHSST